MLSKAIKYQEKSFNLLWDKSDEISSEEYLALYQATHIISVKIEKAQKYGAERLDDAFLRSLNFQAKANYFALKKALDK